MYIKLQSAKLYIVVVLATLLVLYEQPTFAHSNAVDQQVVSAIIKYFARLPNIAADFKQTTNQQTVFGKLIVVKPNNFRCNYYAPYPLLITGNKQYVAIYDYDLEQLTKVPSKNIGLLTLFTQGLIINNKLQIISAKASQNLLKMIAKNLEQDMEISITLSLSPLKLQTLKIIDQSQDTTIEFLKIINIKSAKPELFIIKNPKIFGPQQRLDDKSISTYYE